jgi:hypothetical protein
VNELDRIRKRLESARKGLLEQVATISEDEWKRPPRKGGWSVAEILVHLGQVETRVMSGAKERLRSEPKPRSFRERFHLPIWLVEYRLAKRTSPIPLDEKLITGKAQSLARLTEIRDATLRVLKENEGRELGDYHMKHPFLGQLDFYEWMRTLASHEIRHTKQIREMRTL